ncbi:MAG: hypothetical protein R6V55_03545 [Desulfovermiculus sp.]
MSWKGQLQQEKPWAILGWTRKQWKQSKMCKKAGVSEEKMARLVQSLDHETVQNLKDHAQAEVLVDKIFGEKLTVNPD